MGEKGDVEKATRVRAWSNLMTAAARAAIDADRFLADPHSAIDRRGFELTIAGWRVIGGAWPIGTRANKQAGATRAAVWVSVESTCGNVQAVALVERRGGLRILGAPDLRCRDAALISALAALEVEPLAGELETA